MRYSINQTEIEKLRPCKDRLDNYLKFYGDKARTKRQFMGLKNITHEDKIWVAFRMMSKEQAAKAAVAIARSVLHLYESQYPNDLRPRQAVEAIEQGLMTPEIKNAAYAAAYDAVYANAAAAARAAYNATDAAYAAAAYNATDAADPTGDSDEAWRTKRKEIRTIILKYWKDGKVK